MRVHVDARGAVRHDGARVFAHAHHGRFHVDVPVEEPWRDVLPLRIDDLRVLADAVVCPAEVGDAALGDGHVHVLLDLGRAHVHELRALDHRLGASPWATADRVFEHSHSGFLQNLLIMPRSFDERRRLFGAGSIRSLSALLKLPSTIPF